MLHVTNGDAAVAKMRDAGVRGEVLSWRDVLIDGPVPEGLDDASLRAVRAAYVASRGWGSEQEVLRDFEQRDRTLTEFRSHEEVVLWFEHDLYDQLQLLQILDWFASRPLGRTKLTQVASDEYLGLMPPDEMRRRFASRAQVEPEQITIARGAWAAFRASSPLPLQSLVERQSAELDVLPFLRAALRRQLEELPHERDGLARSERQALEELAAGHTEITALYRAAHHEREDAIYMGDASFVTRLEGMSAGDAPLLRFDDGSEVRPPRDQSEHRAFWKRHVAITDLGRDVIAGREDRVRRCGVDHWLGGVHLYGHDVPWRWNGERVTT